MCHPGWPRFRLTPSGQLTIVTASEGTGTMRVFRRIVHATDFSAASRPAFGKAQELARTSRAQLLIVHVLPVLPLIPERVYRRDHVRPASADAAGECPEAARPPGAESDGPGCPGFGDPDRRRGAGRADRAFGEGQARGRDRDGNTWSDWTHEGSPRKCRDTVIATAGCPVLTVHA
jgi:hypothetical protein